LANKVENGYQRGIEERNENPYSERSHYPHYDYYMNFRQPPPIQSERGSLPAKQRSISNAARERAQELQDYFTRKEIQVIKIITKLLKIK